MVEIEEGKVREYGELRLKKEEHLSAIYSTF
jgi:hypothetical protein